MPNLIDLTADDTITVVPDAPAPAVFRLPEPSKKARLTELVGLLSGQGQDAAKAVLADAPAPRDQDDALYLVAQAMVRLRAS